MAEWARSISEPGMYWVAYPVTQQVCLGLVYTGADPSGPEGATALFLSVLNNEGTAERSRLNDKYDGALRSFMKMPSAPRCPSYEIVP